MERKSCGSGSRCVSTTQTVATPVKMPKKEEDVKPVQPSVKKEDLKPVQQDVKKEAAVEATATGTAAEVKGVKSEVKETVVSAAVKKEEEPVKVNACCGSGIGGGGCA